MPGVHVTGHTLCLAHLDPVGRAAYLAALTPGSDVDHRGTTFDNPLLATLLDALRDPTTGHPRLGDARFDDATFTADVRFDCATFAGGARFGRATFVAGSRFDGVTFAAGSWFGGARFDADARFDGTTFNATAGFGGATFNADARFGHATFTADAGFQGVVFGGVARFVEARFESAAVLGRLWSWEGLDLSGAVFDTPVVIEAAAPVVLCARTRWEATATLRLWHGDLDMNGAVLNFPLAVVSAATDTDPVRVRTVSGVDAAHLVLTDTDLTRCRFLGAFHLDQIRLEGDTHFARTPTGIDPRRGMPPRWTDRLALAEEHHWRALPLHRPRLRAGWTPAPTASGSPSPVPGPAALTALYRQLRKAFEDAKDEPGAADFYMGEMEMRRLDDRPGRNHTERRLLTAYWALSGYGLRASRSLTWLGLAMTATILAMMLWGLPTGDPKPVTTGTQAAPGQPVRLITDNPDPTLAGTPRQRLTAKRADKATRVVLNSVVFRSSGQNLTGTGAYIEMISRLLEPALLALAILAIRGRVKR